MESVWQKSDVMKARACLASLNGLSEATEICNRDAHPRRTKIL
jgi:hypothetical protein